MKMTGKFSMFKSLINILEAQSKLMEKRNPRRKEVKFLDEWILVGGEKGKMKCDNNSIGIDIPIGKSSSCCFSCPEEGSNEKKIGPLTFMPKKYRKLKNSNQCHLVKRVFSSDVSTTLNENGMKMTMDLKEFKPEEISVRVEGDWLVIEAAQDSWNDESKSLVHRHTMRRYELHSKSDIKNITSNIKEGKLNIVVPYKKDFNKDDEDNS